MQFDAPARGRGATSGKSDAAAFSELHGVVDEVFERGAQLQRIADHGLRQIVGNDDLGSEALGLGARSERRGERLRHLPRPDQFAPQHQALGIEAHRIDDQRGEQRKMLGRAADRQRPAALALAEPGD